MASFNLTVEDCSPLVTYSPAGAWEDSPSGDAFIESYSGRNYHRASAEGATASIAFHGSGITFFGGRRPGYGKFNLVVDGQTVVANGDANSPEDHAREILATVSGLSPGNHRAVLTKLDEAHVDIDSITILDQIGSPGSQIRIQNFDDVSPAFTYLPSVATWKTNEQDIFQGSTLHFSEAPDAAVSMTFSGDAVAIYGTMSPDRTSTKVTIDGEEVILGGGFNGHASRLHTKVLLFFRNGLGPGQHKFTLASQSPTPDAPFIDIDAVAVLTGADADASPAPSQSIFTGVITPSNTAFGSSNTGSSTNGRGSSPQTGISKGVIIGSAVGGAIALIACIGLCFFAVYWRRRRRRNDDDDARSPTSPDLPMQQDPKRVADIGTISGPMELESSVFVFPPPTKKPAPMVEKFRHSIAPSYYGSPMSGTTSLGTRSNASTSPLIRFQSTMPSPQVSPRNPVPTLSSPRNYYRENNYASPSISDRATRSPPRRTGPEIRNYNQSRI